MTVSVAAAISASAAFAKAAHERVMQREATSREPALAQRAASSAALREALQSEGRFDGPVTASTGSRWGVR